MNIVDEILNHRFEIVGIRVNGTFYDVEYISPDCMVRAYTIQDDLLIKHIFDKDDLLDFDNVKLYKLQEIEGE